MILNMVGGGVGLNLKVVGGTTQPSGAENTIWVDTQTAISGYAFSAAEPENPADGMVWFETGTTASAPLNIDRSNTVMIYPNSCYQYVGGAWVSKTAQTYVGGAWVDWAIYILNGANVFEELTGGWNVYGSGTASFTEEGLYMYWPADNTGGGNDVSTKNLFALGEYTKLCFDVELAVNHVSLQVGVASSNNWDSSTWTASTTWTGSWNTTDGTIGEKTLEVDISAIDSGYIKIANKGVQGTIKRIYFMA